MKSWMNKAPVLTSNNLPLAPAEARLLLLLSRPTLSPAQQERALELVPQIGDWPALIGTAWRKYVLPLVYQNLAGLGPGNPGDDILEAMRPLALRMTTEMLRRHAAFDWFHERCVIPSGVPYAYLKGRALAERFYPVSALRFYRDIDILVHPRSLETLLRRALEQGCKPFDKSSPNASLELNTRAEIVEFIEVSEVPTILTPQGLLVEIHPEIDQRTSLFPTEDLLHDALETATRSHRIRILPDAPHIVFICYHHTRHLWSKLNWLADLDAICAHPEFNREAVLAHARALRLESTVAATFEFHDLASKGVHPEDLDRPSPGGDLLRACVDGLVGDDELEERMRRGQTLNVLSFKWQEAPVSRWRLLQLQWRRLRPDYVDFRTMPGGRRLRYVLATGLRLKRFALSRLQEVFRR